MKSGALHQEPPRGCMRGAGFSLIMALAVSLNGSISRHAAAQTNTTSASPSSAVLSTQSHPPSCPRRPGSCRPPFLARRGIVPDRLHPLPSRTSAAEPDPLAAATSPATASNTTFRLGPPAGPIAVNSLNFGLSPGASRHRARPLRRHRQHVYLGTTGGGVWKSQNAASATPSTVAFVPSRRLGSPPGVQTQDSALEPSPVQPGVPRRPRGSATQ